MRKPHLAHIASTDKGIAYVPRESHQKLWQKGVRRWTSTLPAGPLLPGPVPASRCPPHPRHRLSARNLLRLRPYSRPEGRSPARPQRLPRCPGGTLPAPHPTHRSPHHHHLPPLPPPPTPDPAAHLGSPHSSSRSCGPRCPLSRRRRGGESAPSPPCPGGGAAGCGEGAAGRGAAAATSPERPCPGRQPARLSAPLLPALHSPRNAELQVQVRLKSGSSLLP